MDQVAMEGEPIPTPETPSPGTAEAEGQDLQEQLTRDGAVESGPVMGWVADFVLTFGFACCAAVAVGWVEPPFAPAFKSPSVTAIEAASRSGGGVVVSDARLGTWSAAYTGNAKWSRTAKIASAGVHGVRVILTVDFAATANDVVPGVLGEYSATVLMHQDGKGQSNEGGCQLQLEWVENNSLQIRQKGPCGDPGNIAPDGTFTATYTKLASSPTRAVQPPPGAADCLKIKDPEARLFCKDPALRVAREISAAVYGDSLAVVRQASPETVAEFEQNDKHWQAEVRRVCLAAEGSQDDPEAGKAACFSQSYDARVNWLRLHSGLVHLAMAAAKDDATGERYSDALSDYSDTYGALALQLPVLERRLRPVLPAKDSEALAVAMTHRGPRTGLFQAGCGPQGCDAHEGAFEIDARTNSVAVALRQGPKITVYSLEGQSADLPKRLHDWLEQRSSHVSDIVYKP